MKKHFIFIVTAFFLALIFATLSKAADVTLQWNPSDGADGYKIYWGQASRSYADPVDVGNLTQHTLQNVTDGIWYFAVTAYNKYGESKYSEEISANIETNRPPVVPAGFSGKIIYRYENGLLEEVEINE